MAEEVKKTKPKEKKETKFEYKLLGHSDKLGMILEMTYELETALFNHNLNMLDEKHSDYDYKYQGELNSVYLWVVDSIVTEYELRKQRLIHVSRTTNLIQSFVTKSEETTEKTTFE